MIYNTPKHEMMELARFGNWSINVYKLEWKGDPRIKFSIDIHDIVNTGQHESCVLYQWLLKVAAEIRFSAEDVYSFNTAFFYVLDNFRSEINIPGHALIAETLKEQQAIMNTRKDNCNMPAEKIPRDNSTWYGKLYKL